MKVIGNLLSSEEDRELRYLCSGDAGVQDSFDLKVIWNLCYDVNDLKVIGCWYSDRLRRSEF